MNPLTGIALVLVALGALVGAAAQLRAHRLLGGETARKAVHVGMGVICLSFPWLFRSDWPVWALAALACLVLAALRLVPALRGSVGQALHSVDRFSLGELYFPIATAVVFSLARGDVALFIAPVALLTFADAAGALVGKRWGKHRFETLEGAKSVEGSLAVGFTAFVCVAGILALASPKGLVGVRGAWEIVLTGLVIGVFAALLEGVSWRGLDNLLLPIAAFAQLSRYRDMPIADLEARLAVLGLLGVAAARWRRGQVINASARLAAVLVLFLVWAVCGTAWLVAPIIFLFGYVRLMPVPKGGRPRHDLLAVICVGSVALLWVFVDAFSPGLPALWCFTAGIAAHQAIVGTVRFSQGCPGWSRGQSWLVAVALAFVTQAAGTFAAGFASSLSPSEWLFGALGVIVGSAVFLWAEPSLQLPDDLNARWWKQGLAAVLSSGVCFLHSQL